MHACIQTPRYIHIDVHLCHLFYVWHNVWYDMIWYGTGRDGQESGSTSWTFSFVHSFGSGSHAFAHRDRERDHGLEVRADPRRLPSACASCTRGEGQRRSAQEPASAQEAVRYAPHIGTGSLHAAGDRRKELQILFNCPASVRFSFPGHALHKKGFKKQ
jgi:hypothetical protein